MVYNVRTKKIKRSRNVIFNENPSPASLPDPAYNLNITGINQDHKHNSQDRHIPIDFLRPHLENPFNIQSTSPPSPTVEDNPKDQSQTRAPNTLDPSNPALFKEDLTYFRQVKDLDFYEVYTVIAKPISFKVFAAVAAAKGWYLHHIDIITAFLYAELKEPIEIELPEIQREEYPDHIGLLMKTIYGLKQSPREWYSLLHDVLVSIGFDRTQSDHSIFVKRQHGGSPLYVMVYVDDLLVLSPSEDAIQQFKSAISKHFDTSDKGKLQRYLAINVHYANGIIHLSQADYVDKILVRFSLENCKPVITPMDKKQALIPFEGTATKGQIHEYQTKIGTLICEKGLSTSGFLFKMAGGAISWTSKKQPCVALSTTESEYIAESLAVQEAIWLIQLLTELGIEGFLSKPIPIYADNNGAIALASNPEFHAATKHIAIRFHRLREEVAAGNVKFVKIPTADMAADGLTKPLGKTLFKRWIIQMGLTVYKNG
ncbi:hypothetical protein PEX2_013290 [Penicillium expansum]|uniref:Reverse transcriptase Ty1/copia-type domain-containing protein n=1 Tax=Penicillium expansum TaxID=27334 RepID=A0A0A2K4Z8_PENEN|nr:hypothetical protein PEX2_013290 [Penicillium expansum]KGO62116.1 hypothetical protein PEX2_013290 [Penicillium expansum]